MSNEHLTGLFGESSESYVDSSGSSEDTIPESFKKLGRSSSVDLKEDVVHTSVGVNMFYSENSADLKTGKGRDDLVEYVFKHASGDYDISAWNQYEPTDVVDLTVYLLDELDSEEELRGKDVVGYLEEFVQEDGGPGYLENYGCLEF